MAGRICDVTRKPLTVAGRRVVAASIGIALGDHAQTGQELLRLADAAMYRAERSQGHGYAIASECLESGDGSDGC